MDVKATAKTVRHTPRKVRLVLNLVRGKSVDEALAILKFMPNHAATDVAKVVKSAAANAEHNNSLNREDLYIKACYADEGITLKRFMPRAKGSASRILKRTSHITVVVSDEK
ncbi:MAG: 50S ribosomal protein L22 [Solobacterium sp.]|jgi:large subunit ribosomal protein L22|nr:50S ribosomal protein L22 [Solobacterium sp.]